MPGELPSTSRAGPSMSEIPVLQRMYDEWDQPIQPEPVADEEQEERPRRSGLLFSPDGVAVAKFVPFDHEADRVSCVVATYGSSDTDDQPELYSWLLTRHPTDRTRFSMEKNYLGLHPTQVTSMAFLSELYFVTGDEHGELRQCEFGVFEDEEGEEDVRMELQAEFARPHLGKVTGMSFNPDKSGRFATVSDDGLMLYRNYEFPDSEPITSRQFPGKEPLKCVVHNAPNEVVAGGFSGTLRLWDLRVDLDNAAVGVLLPEEIDKPVMTKCVTVHPTLTHLIAAGYSDGSVAFWDLRRLPTAVSYVQLHRSEVTGLKFHPRRPLEEIVTCSGDGTVGRTFTASGEGARQVNFGALGGPIPSSRTSSQCVFLGDTKSNVPRDEIVPAVDLRDRVMTDDITPDDICQGTFTSLDAYKDHIVAARADGRAFVCQLD